MRDVFAAAGGQSILLITHRREGLDLVDEVVELEKGRAHETGARCRLQSAPLPISAVRAAPRRCRGSGRFRARA